MKVKDLILRLQECDPEYMVVVDGYEGGVCELLNMEDCVEVAMCVNTESYYGPHELVSRPYDAYDGFTHIHAVYLPRGLL